MALVIQDRVRETTQVVGTGSITLLGAVTGYQSFSTIGNGNTTYYACADQGGPNWEVGIGTYSTGGTLARTTVLSSSNGGSLVNFTAGTKDVFVTQPSEKAVYEDASNNVTLPAGLTVTNDASISGLTVGKGSGGIVSNAAFGYYALPSNTTGSNNTSIGQFSLYANTSGAYNTALGQQALNANTTANNNTAVGYQAGYYTSTGFSNFFGGQGAGHENTTGTSQVFVGATAGFSNTTGNYNVAVGQAALQNNTTASNNTAVGYQAGYSNTTGVGNTILGFAGGAILTTGSYNVYIGYSTNASSASATGEFVLATGGATGKGNNTGFINAGGGGVYQGNNSTLWSITSDERLKKNIVDNTDGLNKITAIKVRNFEYRLPEEITEVSPNQAIQKTGVQLGAIAQELQTVLPECVKQESTGIYTVDADPLIWYLVNAVKELSAKVAQLEAKLGA